MFHYCYLNEVQDIDKSKSCTLYKRGQVLFHEGSNPIALYCVSSGRIKVYRSLNNGKEQIIRLAKGGDFVGYSSLLIGRPYPVSAKAMEDSLVCMVPKISVAELVQNNKQFSENLIKLLSRALEGVVKKMTDLAYKPVRGRLAEALLFLQSFYKDEGNPNGIVTITREDLASFAGTVKETTVRILTEFKNENLINTNGSNIEIRDAEGLLRISRLYD